MLKKDCIDGNLCERSVPLDAVETAAIIRKSEYRVPISGL